MRNLRKPWEESKSELTFQAYLFSAVGQCCDICGFRGAHASPPYFCKLRYFSFKIYWMFFFSFFINSFIKKSLNGFQLTVRPWILVPDARKTLIWHSHFHFCTVRCKKKPLIFSVPFNIRTGDTLPPFPKVMDPPLCEIDGFLWGFQFTWEWYI